MSSVLLEKKKNSIREVLYSLKIMLTQMPKWILVQIWPLSVFLAIKIYYIYNIFYLKVWMDNSVLYTLGSYNVSKLDILNVIALIGGIASMLCGIQLYRYMYLGIGQDKLGLPKFSFGKRELKIIVLLLGAGFLMHKPFYAGVHYLSDTYLSDLIANIGVRESCTRVFLQVVSLFLTMPVSFLVLTWACDRQMSLKDIWSRLTRSFWPLFFALIILEIVFKVIDMVPTVVASIFFAVTLSENTGNVFVIKSIFLVIALMKSACFACIIARAYHFANPEKE